MTCVPFITTGVVSLKIHFQPSVYVCVCSLYSTLSNLLLRKGKFIGLEPNPRKRKTQEKRENFRSPLDARHFCCSCCAPLNCLDRHKVDAYIFYFSLVFEFFFFKKFKNFHNPIVLFLLKKKKKNDKSFIFHTNSFIFYWCGCSKTHKITHKTGGAATIVQKTMKTFSNELVIRFRELTPRFTPGTFRERSLRGGLSKLKAHTCQSDNPIVQKLKPCSP